MVYLDGSAIFTESYRDKSVDELFFCDKPFEVIAGLPEQLLMAFFTEAGHESWLRRWAG